MNLRQIYYKKQYKILKFEQFLAELQAFKVIFKRIGPFQSPESSPIPIAERIFFSKMSYESKNSEKRRI